MRNRGHGASLYTLRGTFGKTGVDWGKNQEGPRGRLYDWSEFDLLIKPAYNSDEIEIGRFLDWLKKLGHLRKISARMFHMFKG